MTLVPQRLGDKGDGRATGTWWGNWYLLWKDESLTGEERKNESQMGFVPTLRNVSMRNAAHSSYTQRGVKMRPVRGVLWFLNWDTSLKFYSWDSPIGNRWRYYSQKLGGCYSPIGLAVEQAGAIPAMARIKSTEDSKGHGWLMGKMKDKLKA